MQTKPAQKKPALAVVVHRILDRETFASIADLSEAVKREAARLRLPYDASQLSAVFDSVSRTRRLVDEPARQPQRHERADHDSRTMSAADARRILAMITDRLQP